MTFDLKIGDKIKVIDFNCGKLCEHKFTIMNIRRGTIIEIISVQPIYGPYTIRINNYNMSIGRNMFKRIIYEKI